MKIIKAIWKGNEVPTNEYFLWLKYEDNGFVLYVRGQKGWEKVDNGSGSSVIEGYTLYSNQVFNLNNIPAKPTDGNKYFLLAAEGNTQYYSQQVSYIILTSDPETNNGNWNSVFHFYVKYGEFESNVYPSNTIGYLASKGYVDEMFFMFSATGTFTEQEFENIVSIDPRHYKNFPQSMGEFFEYLASQASWHCPITFKLTNTPPLRDTYMVTQKFHNDQNHWKLIATRLDDSNSIDSIVVERDGNTFSVAYNANVLDGRYLPLTAGENEPLSGTLYSRAIRPVVNGDAFGVRDESKKFTPYIFPARIFYDSARWGVKRVISCIPTDPNAATFATGVLDFVIPNVNIIKYRVTINEVYDNAKIIDTQAMMYFSNYTNMTYHSGSGLQSASGSTMEVKVAKTTDGKAHLLIGDVSKTYAPLTIIEVEVISTAGGTETIDTIYNKLNPTFVTDLSDYTTVATLVSLDY